MIFQFLKVYQNNIAVIYLKFQFVGTKKKVKYFIDKISGQGERE